MIRPSEYDEHDRKIVARSHRMIWEDIEAERLEDECHSDEARAEVGRIKMRKYHHDMRVFDD